MFYIIVQMKELLLENMNLCDIINGNGCGFMKKIINGSRIEFWNEKTNQIIMYIDYPIDECIWYFNDSELITITKEMELFELLKSIMSQQYKFNDDEILIILSLFGIAIAIIILIMSGVKIVLVI